LEFHHSNDDKEFPLANGWGKTLAKIKEEMDKCDLLCANCHRELHVKLRKKEVIK